jgi:hypothetical protein
MATQSNCYSWTNTSIKDICNIYQGNRIRRTNIYWSVENNGLGEAALLVINDFGEENIPGLFISANLLKKDTLESSAKDLILHTVVK